MTDLILSNAQKRILEDAANFPNDNIERFTLHLPAVAQKSLLDALIRKGCIEQKGYGYYITATGCNAVGRDATPPAKTQHETKQSIIIKLLSREEGVTLPELIAATEWKSHSVRGHLSNLRKKRNLPIETFTNTNGTRSYRIVSTKNPKSPLRHYGLI